MIWQATLCRRRWICCSRLPMKVLVIHGSMRKNGNTGILADEFIRGAQDAGHEVEKVELRDKKFGDCFGCRACHNNGGSCVQKDDMAEILEKVKATDVIVLASPLYYFGMSAQLKTIVDRFYSRTGKLHGKKSIMMATAYNSADWTMEALENHYETLVRYMEWEDVGQVWATGCGARSLVEKSSFADMAYKIGANL